jgi:hypothetical protein
MSCFPFYTPYLLFITTYIKDINKVFGNRNDWFKINLSLNFDKTYYVQFLTKNNHEINIHISCGNKLITNTYSTNFLGLIIDCTLSWKNHVDKLMSKLSSACYAIRAVKSLMTQESLRIIYFFYFQSIMTYGISFWGSSSCCSNIFKIQKKRIIRIITDSRSRVSCRELFKKLKILLLPSQYIFSLLLFVIKNRDLFKSNSEIRSINTRHRTELHPPVSNLTMFQNGTIYF